MMATGAVLFPDAKHVRLNTPVGVQVANYFRRINMEGVGTQNMDTPAAIAAFINGEGGIYPTGTWMIGSFERKPKRRDGRSTRATPFFPIRGCGEATSNM